MSWRFEGALVASGSPTIFLFLQLLTSLYLLNLVQKATYLEQHAIMVYNGHTIFVQLYRLFNLA